MNKIVLSPLLIFLLSYNLLLAQGPFKQTTLRRQIENSSLVIEGQVISKKSFWDVNHENIYTVNTVEVYKVFKGQSIKTIQVITLGGSVGLRALKVSPSLNLQIGDIGLFNLVNNKALIGTQAKIVTNQYKVYSSIQGFYKYNFRNDMVINPFYKKTGISETFYNEIIDLTRMDYLEIKTMKSTLKKSLNIKALDPNLISFSPSTSTAGTKTILTITGDSFGTALGKVGFSNADDGGSSFINALDTQVLSWTDSKIEVEIPSRAGTGQIQVTNNDNLIDVSAEDLIITFSEFNIESDDVPNTDSGIVYAYQTQHVNTNNNGGYTWQMHSGFLNDTEFPGAKASFKRAMETWRCTTGINWIISNSPSSIDNEIIKSDGFNIIKFDDGDELDDGVVARCYSWYSGCISSGVNAEWFIEELDIVFDDDINWCFGEDLPQSNQYDFETVTLHELGHGQQLGHVINMNKDAMHFNIFRGSSQRILNKNNIEAATAVQIKSTSSSVCSEPLMRHHECFSEGREDTLINFISVFPNPAKQLFYIKNESDLQLNKIMIYDIRGRLIYEYEIINKLNIIPISLIDKASGLYFVDIYSGTEVVTKKLFKQ